MKRLSGSLSYPNEEFKVDNEDMEHVIVSLENVEKEKCALKQEIKHFEALNDAKI